MNLDAMHPFQYTMSFCARLGSKFISYGGCYDCALKFMNPQKQVGTYMKEGTYPGYNGTYVYMSPQSSEAHHINTEYQKYIVSEGTIPLH